MNEHDVEPGGGAASDAFGAGVEAARRAIECPQCGAEVVAESEPPTECPECGTEITAAP